MSSVEEIEAALQGLSQEDYQRIARWVLEGDQPPDQELEKKVHTISELRGLGKEVWAGVDPDRYIDEERSSWPG